MKACVAVANKNARIVCALLAKDESIDKQIEQTFPRQDCNEAVLA